MADFFSSDWHLNHTNISGPRLSKWSGGYRDFNSLEEMNNLIITNINKTVGIEDNLYFLGDFCFGDHKLTPYWRSLINCKNIFWIRGNHDGNQKLYRDNFTWTGEVKNIKSNGQSIFLSHYKHAIWDKSHHGTWHLYAHSHASAEHWVIGKSMDVGIDNAYKLLGEYRPFSFEEIKQFMDARGIHSPDHHNHTTNQ